MPKEVVGKCLLQYLLNHSRMTQAELADITGISRQQISEYINNTRIMSLYNAKMIAHILKCNIDDLYEWNL